MFPDKNLLPESMSQISSTDAGVPRRAFLKGSTGALVFAGLSPLAVFGGNVARAADSDFSKHYFDALTGEWFHIDSDGWNSLELVDVVAADVAPRLDQFSVTFRGSPHLEFEEGTYDVSPPDGSVFPLYLQPVGSDGDGNCYQASFSIVKPVVPACAPVEQPA
jgi:hypothetical protein